MTPPPITRTFDTEPMRLQPEEPAVTRWTAGPTAHLADLLLARARERRGAEAGPLIVAVDSRGGAGKSTLARTLCAQVPGTVILSTDDLAWNEPLFGWGHLLAETLTGLRRDGALDLTPPAWAAHGREGSVHVPAGTPVVVVEGTGASQRPVADLVDATVWVASDDEVAEARGLARDIEQGINGDAEEATHFWHEWMAAERPFFATDRPWERADLIMAGTPPTGLRDGESAWALPEQAGSAPATPMDPREAEVRRRMDARELYTDEGPGLEALSEQRTRGKELAREFNATSPGDADGRRRLLEEIFGSVGEMVWMEPPIHVAYGVHTHVGSAVYANAGLMLIDDSPITIGDGVMFGPRVMISTAGHPVHPAVRPHGEQFSAPVVIEDDVWVGGNVTILPGVTIGRGSVVAAGAVVTANVPPMTVVGGVPARVLREITDADRDWSYRAPRTLEVPGEACN